MQNQEPIQAQPAHTRHEFALILVLFVAFRVMALLAFRAGGQILDHSDFYWYYEYGQLTRQGYIPYINLWSQYPPLFPFLIIGIEHVSSLLPPWESPALWFSLLLGGTLLIFETGNLVLIYAIARQLGDERTAIRSAWFYTALFTPVYTLIGWFEGFPLFFALLSLYLLVRRRPLWSALTTGVGFMIKFIPLILLPIGAQVSNGKRRPRVRISLLNLEFDIYHLIFYLGIFALTVVAIGLPFYLLNPRLVWGSLLVNSTRQSWETVWALLEGYYGYGVAPLDMRDVTWTPENVSGISLPWLWITLAFGVIYLFAYTRPVNWKDPRNLVAFTGFTLLLFLLYSRGYSPQWLGWALVFIALLIPNLRGAFYAVVTGLVNLIEANIYMILVPDEHWLLTTTVLLRTLIFVLLAIEFMLIVQPQWLTQSVRRARRWGLMGLAGLILVGIVPAGVRFVNAYFDARYQLSPYQSTIQSLRDASTGDAAIVLNHYDHKTYNWLYAYLRRDYTFYMLDDYAPPGDSVEARTITYLERIAADHSEWWLFDSDLANESPSEAVAADWLSAHGVLLDVSDVDGGKLYHFSVEE